MSKEKKKSSEPVEVVESVVDLEAAPIESVVYTFQSVSYLFMLGAIGAAVAWFIYVAKWTDKVYTNEAVSTNDLNGTNDRKEGFFFDVVTLCFQALVASVLLYFVFRHHYKHH